MAVPRTLLNARLTLVERPDRTGIGGDIVGTPTVLYTGSGTAVDIVYEPVSQLVRLPDQREVVVTTELFVDLEFIPLWSVGDLVSWVDFVGRTHTRGEIVEANTEGAPGMTVVHWRLKIVGT